MRKITDYLYLGSSRDALEYGGEFDKVISLADENKHTTEAFPILDNDEHDPETVADAVTAVCDSITDKNKTLLHCRAGISRSTVVASAALVQVDEDLSFEEAYDICQTGFTHAEPSLRKTARELTKGNLLSKNV